MRSRAATSASFLVDDNGIIRFVHPGVMYYPSDKPEDAEHNHDFELLDRAIGVLLGIKLLMVGTVMLAGGSGVRALAKAASAPA